MPFLLENIYIVQSLAHNVIKFINYNYSVEILLQVILS